LPTYTDLGLTADPVQLQADGEAWIATQVDGWRPSPLEQWLLSAVARMAAEVVILAGRVPLEIFTYFGSSVLRIPVETAAPATGTVVFSLSDNPDGRTIDAGAQLNIDDEPFETAQDTVFAAAQLTGTVTVIALQPGTQANDLTGLLVELVSPTLTWVDGVALSGVTGGGTDGETGQQYADRLADELPTLSPKAILIADFEALARAHAAVERAVAIDNYIPGVNETQQVAVTSATGGTFTLTFSGQTTAGIAYNATAAAIQTALEALSNIDPGDVLVTGGPAGTSPPVVEFRGQYAGTDVAQMTASATGLTGAGAAVTVTTTRPGVAPQTAAEGAVTVAVQDVAGEAIPATSRQEVADTLAAGRVLNLAVAVIDPTYTSIDVTFTAHAYPGWDPATVELAAEQAVRDALAPANWGRPPLADQTAWVDEPTVYRNVLIGVIERVEGVRRVDTLTLAKTGQALATTDVALLGPAGLPRAGAINGTVTL
jgi:hypothetical protein